MTRFRHELSDAELIVLNQLLEASSRLNDSSNALWGEVIDAEKSHAYDIYLHDIKNEVFNYIEPLIDELRRIEEAE